MYGCQDGPERSTTIEVLRAPRYELQRTEADNAAIAEARRAACDSLSPCMIRYTIAEGAGHDIQIDRPDVVIQATRRLIGLARVG